MEDPEKERAEDQSVKIKKTSSAYPYLPSDIPPYTSADDGTWSSKPLTHE